MLRGEGLLLPGNQIDFLKLFYKTKWLRNLNMHGRNLTNQKDDGGFKTEMLIRGAGGENLHQHGAE